MQTRQRPRHTLDVVRIPRVGERPHLTVDVLRDQQAIFEVTEGERRRQPCGTGRRQQCGLRTAIDAVLTGKPAPARQLPSIGCNIKWKPGNEPSYFG